MRQRLLLEVRLMYNVFYYFLKVHSNEQQTVIICKNPITVQDSTHQGLSTSKPFTEREQAVKQLGRKKRACRNYNGKTALRRIEDTRRRMESGKV